jgi:regulatory protein
MTPQGRAPRGARARPSLKMQAIAILSRREHSRQELRVKLLRSLRRPVPEGADAEVGTDADASAGAEAADRTHVEPEEAAPDPEAVVDHLLDWLAAHGYLSDARFVESRIHVRAGKQGTALIRQELARHGLALAPEQAATLRTTEFARAQALWQRRFGAIAETPKERARQARFLTARGFAADIVRRIVGGEEDGG